MQCPECGATVGADEKFCGNCGTSLQNATSQAGVYPVDPNQPGLDVQPPANRPPAGVEPLPDQAAGQVDTEPAWDLGQETIYSEPAPFTQEPVTPPPATIDYVPAAGKARNNKTIIAIVVLVVLLLCCCAAVIAALLIFGPMEGGQSWHMVSPSLAALL